MAGWRLIGLQGSCLILLAFSLISCGGTTAAPDQSNAGTPDNPANSPERVAFYTNIESWTAEVRGMTIGTLLNPAPGTLLAKEVAQRGGVTYANCSDFSIVLSEILNTNSVTNRIRDIVLDSEENHVVVEYYDPYLSRWNIADPTFGLVYFDDANQVGQSIEDVSGLVQKNIFANIDEKFVTPQGDYFLVSYLVDPVTMFLNPVQGNSGPVNDPRPYMREHSLQDVEGVADNYVFQFAHATDSLTLEVNEWGTFSPKTITPDSTWLLSSELSLQAEWYIESGATPTQVYTFPLFSIPKSVIITPADGSQDVDPSIPLQFTWRPVAGAQAYQLNIGTMPGSSDIFSSGDTQMTQLNVPLNTRQTYYARILTRYENQWSYRDSSFQTGTGIAHLISPANGATADASSPVEFSWNSISNSQTYGLLLGMVPGGDDIYRNTAIQGAGISLTLNPGKLYYVRVLTEKGSYWYYSDSSFRTAPN